MRKLMSVAFVILLMHFSVFAETFAYIENDDITTAMPLSSFKAEASLVLDMKELASYDIGFSRINSATSPEVISTIDITPSIASSTDDKGNIVYDYSKITATQYLYAYWNVISDLTLDFSLSIDGPLKNMSALEGYQEMDWVMRVRYSGNVSTIESEKNNLTIENFARYTRPEDNLGGNGIALIAISINEDVENIRPGIYSGNIILSVVVS